MRLAADRAITGLRPAPTDAEMAALRDAFVPHLVRVRLDDGKRVRQPACIAELPQEALRLIRALVEARLLTTRDELVEVAHEALFKAWPTLDHWLTEEHALLTDLERIRGAHEIWAQAPTDQKTGALLHGLLLSRARDWLIKYPQRFLGSGIEPVRALIAASAAAEDARSARARSVRRRLFQATAAAAMVFRRGRRGRGLAVFCCRAGAPGGRACRGGGHRRPRTGRTQLRHCQECGRPRGVPHRPGPSQRAGHAVLDAAQSMMDELAQAAPGDLQLQRSRFAMLTAFVDTYLGAGDLIRARVAAEAGLVIIRKLALLIREMPGCSLTWSTAFKQSAVWGYTRVIRRGRFRPTRRASRSSASSPLPIRATRNGSAD